MSSAAEQKVADEGAIPAWVADRFEVVGRIGEGGMGWILRVRDRVSDQHLALKLAKPRKGHATVDHEEFLQREYHALEQLAHPRIIRVHDYGVCPQAGPFYTMDLLDGEDLSGHAPMPWARACPLLRDVASSLAIVHSRRLVHRDINPRNVLCTSDGRASLIDFGALTPVGVARTFVGTLPFSPPEAAFGQVLDQRSDLYSLGVLAYWLLSGRRPYNARHLRELRNAWRSKPLPLSTLVPDLPPALDALVASLMSHNPAGRPQQAAEVIDRLTAIGGLPPDQDLGVVRAYLTTPALVGRDREVVTIRKAIVRAARGRGSSMLLRGAPGAGSTRMLDACVMEAKLVGALVARADAGAKGEGLAAVRDALEQWASGLPEAQGDALQRSAGDPAESQPAGTSELQQDVHARVASAVLQIARKRLVVLAIDDAQRADPRSLAVFALLARAAGDHKLVLLSTLPASLDTTEGSAPLRMLDEASRALELTPWAPEQTEGLLRSVFGDVPNVSLVADRIHRVARGNPRDTMQLAQHLVDVDAVRYQRGSWQLPTQLDEVALPATMAEAQRQAALALESGTRALAATLALAPNLSALDFGRCARLAPDAVARLEELERHGLLVRHREGFAFRHRAFANALLDGLSPEQRDQAHVALAEMHEACGDHPLTVAYHLHHGSRPQACLQRVRPCLEMDENEQLTRQQLAALEALLENPDRYPLSALETHRVRMILVRFAATLDPGYARHCGPSFEQLRHDTGLVHWDEYPELEPAARIGQCIQRAMADFEATPEAERGVAPIEAIRSLAVLVRSLTSVYARTLATAQLAGLAVWLEPLRPLAPVLDLLHELTCVSTDRAVREKRVVHRFLECARRFGDASIGLEEGIRRSAAAICTYCAAMDEAKQGKPEALQRADKLAEMRSFAALAWHVRMLSHIYAGRTDEAERCRERMELLEVQQVEANHLLAMSVLYEAWGYEMCEDLVGLRGALRRVEQEAERYPGWQPWATIYAGDVHRLRGAAQQALEHYERAAAQTAPGEHLAWPHAAQRRVVALRELGRLRESLTLARDLVAFAEREDLEPTNLVRFDVARARTEIDAGLHEEAEASLARAMEVVGREALDGVPVGIIHEARARLAIARGDAEAFAIAARDCAAYFTSDHSPALTAKYERLVADARASGQGEDVVRDARADHHAALELMGIADDQARATAVLSLLTKYYGVDDACLFGVTRSGVQSLATQGEVEADAQLCARVDTFLSAELVSSETVTLTVHDERAATGTAPGWTIGKDQTFFPLLLSGELDGVDMVAGVALLRIRDALPMPPQRAVLRALGQALLAGEQVAGLRAEP